MTVRAWPAISPAMPRFGLLVAILVAATTPAALAQTNCELPDGGVLTVDGRCEGNDAVFCSSSNPSTGTRTTLNARWTGAMLGGDVDVQRYEAEFSWFQSLMWKFVLELRQTLGVASWL